MIGLIKRNIIKIILIKFFVLSIVGLFTVQFQVDELNQGLQRVESEIASYEEEIKILDIEWVYLTRPERLRKLAATYLENSDYIDVSQIKNYQQLKPYFSAKYNKSQEKTYAARY